MDESTPQKKSEPKKISFYAMFIMKSALAAFGVCFFLFVIWLFFPALFSPMHMAIYGRNMLAIELLAYTPFINERATGIEVEPTTPLEEAIKIGDIEIVKILIKHEASIANREVFYLRKAMLHPDIVEFLVNNAFVDINQILAKASKEYSFFGGLLFLCAHNPANDEKANKLDQDIMKSFEILLKKGLDPKAAVAKHLEMYKDTNSVRTSTFALLLKASQQTPENPK